MTISFSKYKSLSRSCLLLFTFQSLYVAVLVFCPEFIVFCGMVNLIGAFSAILEIDLAPNFMF